MKRLLFITALAFCVFPTNAVAQTTMKDATLHAYSRYGDVNIRIDKIESVRHYDGNPILGTFDGNGNSENGYLIVSLSVQNPGTASVFMPNLGTTLFLEDQSKVEASDIRGPYVGTKTAEAPGRIAPKESLRVRYVVPEWPGTRITKMVIDPNNGAAQLRFQIKPEDITPLAEIPRAKPTE